MPAVEQSCKTESIPALIPMRTPAPSFDLASACLAVIAVLSAFWSPFAQDSGCTANHDRAVIERRIFHERSREHSFFKSRRINEWEHCRSGRAPGLQGTVVLIVLEIASAHEDEDVA